MTERIDTDWIPLKKMSTAVLTPAALRKIIFERELNNANYFLRRFGKKWLISPTRFFEWLQNGGKI